MDDSSSRVIRLRRVLRPAVLGVAGLALIIGPQIIGASPAVRIALPLAGPVLAYLMYLDIRTSYVAEPGRLTVRRAGHSGSVNLNRLSAAETRWVAVARRSGRFVLILTDDQGNSVGLDLAGTTLASRRKLLDVLAPYVMAPGVFQDGQVDRALAGVLWKPGFRR